MTRFKKVSSIVALAVMASFAYGQAPSLPSGLGGVSSPPSLPTGLGSKGSEQTPSRDVSVDGFWGVTGFIEARYGRRLSQVPGFSDTSLAELRTQLNYEREIGDALLDVGVDFLFDDQASGRGFDLESPDSWVDIRTLSLEFQASETIDVKVGRQVATWGVGDLVFINDLFPKDWNSFFLGRDVEYLKAPQDSLRVSWYTDLANVEVVYSPKFESDRFIDGSRLVYFDSLNGGLTPEPTPIAVKSPGSTFDADEWHFRASRLIGRFEYAAYAYRGFWKSPAGYDVVSGLSTFPALAVYGASLRGPFAKGVVSSELGYYDSLDYGKSEVELAANSEVRFLLGYEKELGAELTGGVQYYVERKRGMFEGDRDREMVTARLTKQLFQQSLMLSFFAFYSPSDSDSYTRLGVTWKPNDDWRYDAGFNLFDGKESTFFGQFGDNENAYLSVRRVF